MGFAVTPPLTCEQLLNIAVRTRLAGAKRLKSAETVALPMGEFTYEIILGGSGANYLTTDHRFVVKFYNGYQRAFAYYEFLALEFLHERGYSVSRPLGEPVVVPVRSLGPQTASEVFGECVWVVVKPFVPGIEVEGLDGLDHYALERADLAELKQKIDFEFESGGFKRWLEARGVLIDEVFDVGESHDDPPEVRVQGSPDTKDENFIRTLTHWFFVDP